MTQFSEAHRRTCPRCWRDAEEANKREAAQREAARLAAVPLSLRGASKSTQAMYTQQP